MKKNFLLVVILSISSLKVLSNEKPVSSKIKEVTVFLQGAQVTRKANVSLTSGENTLVFNQLPARLNPQSIQVGAAKSVVVLSVSHEYDYINQQIQNEKIGSLQDKQKQIQEEIARQQSLVAVYEQEEKLLLTNQKLGSEQQGVSVSQLREAADFYRQRLQEIKFKQLEIKKLIEKLIEEKNKIDNSLREENAKNNQPSSKILVKVRSDRPQQSDMVITYLLDEAGWLPTYDLRVQEVGEPLGINYKAKVYQNSGEDWKDVQLTISTGNPQTNKNKPVLATQYVDFQNLVVRNPRFNDAAYDKNVRKKAIGAPAPRQEGVFEDVEVEEVTVSRGYQAPEVAVVQNQITAEFVIEKPYTVPSDGKQHAVDMQQYSVPAHYAYYAAPALDNEAFLTASVTDWEKLNLLEGEANLFFEGKFVGSVFLDVNNVQDTLEFSLGNDKSIVVKREVIKDFSVEKFFGSKQKEIQGYTIQVRNNKQRPISITIEDRVPVSKNEDISVEIQENSGAKVNQTKGILTWKYNLQHKEVKEMKVVYNMKYPSSRKVVLH